LLAGLATGGYAFSSAISTGFDITSRPIPENDIWIAAIALQNDLTLVARDAHFLEVDGLKTEAW
jgi:tRNA(fMet)-specific endonuclease VapC